MSSKFQLLKIVTAAGLAEAKQLFSQRQKLGISGVIFTPELEVPAWTNDQKKRLSECLYTVDVNNEDAQHIMSQDWLDLGKPFADRLISLSREFDMSATNRKCRFLQNNDLAERPHRDLSAYDGWIHFHESGESMKCIKPIGDAPVLAQALGSYAEFIDADDIQRLVLEGLAEWVHLQPRTAIVFDHNMVHESGWGPRFRAVAYG